MPKKSAVVAPRAPEGAEARPAPPVATNGTRGASPGRTKSKVTAWCEHGQRVESGVFASATSADSWHTRCKGVILGANGQVQFTCGCGCHTGQKRCSDCGADDAELDPATLRCANRTHCAERIRQRLETDPHWGMLQACAAAGKAAAATREPRAPSATRPREGRCVHCGEPTRGGLFLPGHDAKLKADLKRQADANDVDAATEVILRRWDTAHDRSWSVYTRALAEVEKLPEDGGQWLRDRVAGRWAL